MPARDLALSLLLAAWAGCVAGQNSFDCSNCDRVAPAAGTGELRCHCNATVEVPGFFSRSGTLEFSTVPQCGGELVVGGVWDGEPLTPQSAYTGEEIELEGVFCGDITLTFDTVVVTEDGAYLCPVIAACGIVSLNTDEGLCIRIASTASLCLQYAACGSCAASPCAWCSASNVCLRKGAGETDTCQLCADGLLFDTNTCPPGPAAGKAERCAETTDRAACEQLACTWFPETGSCALVTEAPPPGPPPARTPFPPAAGSRVSFTIDDPKVPAVNDREEGEDKFAEYRPSASNGLQTVLIIMIVVLVCACAGLAIMIRRSLRTQKYLRVKQNLAKVAPTSSGEEDNVPDRSAISEVGACSVDYCPPSENGGLAQAGGNGRPANGEDHSPKGRTDELAL